MRLRSLFPHAEARTTAITAAICLYCVSLQVARLFLRPLELFHDAAHLTTLDGLAFVGSSLLFQAGFGLLAFGVIGFSSRRTTRKLATFAVQALAVLIAGIETAGHAYYLDAGTSLDFAITWYSVSRFQQLGVMAVHSVSPLLFWPLAGVVAVVLALPWIADRRVTVRHSGAPPRGRTLLCAGCLIASVPVAAAGLLTSSPKFADRAAARDSVLNVVATYHRRSVPAEGARLLLGDDLATLAPPQSDLAPRNLVVIILESTRAQSLTPWNPSLPTAPYLASLAKRSLRFDRFYSVQPHTARALRAILCGFEPEHRIGPPNFTPGIASHCLANLLRGHGYQTAYFQTAGEQFENRTFAVFSMGYQHFYGPSRYSHEGFQRVNYLGYEDDSMLAPSRDWLEAHGRNGPFFTSYLTVNAHYHCTLLTRYPPQLFADDEEVNCYLNALRSDDLFVRALLRQYQELGLYQNTLFVILADHGEAFGEHGRRTHNDVPFEEGLRIPLLIHDPGATLVPPGVREDPGSQLDLAPTLLSLLGFSIRSGHYQGSSLLAPHPQVPIRAACYDPETCLSRVQGDEKFIHHFGRRPDQLFDLARDPGETTNLAARYPEHAHELRRDLLAWDRRINDGYTAVEVGTSASP